jgi:tetratricopeptide (TPR) repeat protein
MKLIPLLLLPLALIQGCSITADRDAPAPVRDATVSRPAPPTAPAQKTDDAEVYAYREPLEPVFKPSRPVLALVEKAEAQRAAGDLAGAAATLERALRIERRNPNLWNRLAQVRLDQGDYAQARSLAAKSDALAGDAPGLRRDNARIAAAADRAGKR